MTIPMTLSAHGRFHTHTACMRAMLAALWCCAGMGAATADTGEAALPAFQSGGALQYSCGGIGLDESTAMRGAMARFPLALLFARHNGEYLADIAVEIQGTHGAPMAFTATGPVCLLQLPEGRYTVHTTSPEGATQVHQVHVRGTGHTLDVRY